MGIANYSQASINNWGRRIDYFIAWCEKYLREERYQLVGGQDTGSLFLTSLGDAFTS